jgi:glycosyltransferase involved in cell wall biosynthesis
MSNEMLCSIITVCYNSEKTIRRTIESVLIQTYENIEYIIIDGASTDGTLDIIKEYEPKFQGRMKWISEPDDGIYFAMNKGISMARGVLIGIVNSDDFYEKQAVEAMMSSMTDSPYQILYGMERLWKDGREERISLMYHTFLRERMISHPASFITMKLYKDYGMYDTEFVSAADYDFMLRMYDKPEVEFIPVNKLISNFSSGGMCSTSRAYYDLLKVQKRHGIITNKEYKKTVVKCRIYDFIHGTNK